MISSSFAFSTNFSLCFILQEVFSEQCCKNSFFLLQTWVKTVLNQSSVLNFFHSTTLNKKETLIIAYPNIMPIDVCKLTLIVICFIYSIQFSTLWIEEALCTDNVFFQNSLEHACSLLWGYSLLRTWLLSSPSIVFHLLSQIWAFIHLFQPVGHVPL